MKAMKALPLLAMMAATTSCSTYSLEELRRTTPSGSSYQNALAARYLDFADDEARNYDWYDSGYFADKGLLAAYGKDVQPEMIDRWDVPEPRKMELALARTALMDQLTPEKISQKPNDAADAVAFFDCWIENEEEAWQADDISYCRDKHLQAVARLKEESPASVAEEAPPEQPVVAEEPVAPPAPECQKCEPPPQPLVEAPKEPPPPAPAAIEKQAYLVMFQFGKASVDMNGRLILDSIVDDLKKLPHEGYQIVVNGHTDTVGSARFNMELSKKRSDAVRQELIDRGVPLEKIQAFGFGETDLKVKTKDGRKEPANRRVEIFLGDDRPAEIQQHDAAPAIAPQSDATPAPIPVAETKPEAKPEEKVAEKPAAPAEAPAETQTIANPPQAEAPAPAQAEARPAPAAAAPVAEVKTEAKPAEQTAGPVDTSPKAAEQTFATQIVEAVKEKEQAAMDAKLRAQEAVRAAELADQEAAQARDMASKLASIKPAAAAPELAPASEQ